MLFFLSEQFEFDHPDLYGSPTYLRNFRRNDLIGCQVEVISVAVFFGVVGGGLWHQVINESV